MLHNHMKKIWPMRLKPNTYVLKIICTNTIGTIAVIRLPLRPRPRCYYANYMIINEDKAAHAFFTDALATLDESDVEYMLGGAFAIFHYTGLFRDTKDLDVYCKFADCTRLLKHFADKGYEVHYHDVRWLAKIFRGGYFIDVIFDTVNNICKVDDTWFEHATETTLFETKVKIIPAVELYWSKIYVQNRERYDGADLNHLMLKAGKTFDWHRLLTRVDEHWHLLLAQIIQFQFVYPTDYRDIIPKWLFDELMKRANEQYDLPPSVVRVCRGPMIDQTQYAVDIKKWDYKSYTIITI